VQPDLDPSSMRVCSSGQPSEVVEPVGQGQDHAGERGGQVVTGVPGRLVICNRAGRHWLLSDTPSPFRFRSGEYHPLRDFVYFDVEVSGTRLTVVLPPLVGVADDSP
jgi:hypothetical protein